MDIKIIKKDVKNITLKVKATKEIILTIPEKATDEYVNNFLKRKDKWIKDQLRWFSKNNLEVEMEKKYISGESFKYLGKNYRLKVNKSIDEGVKLYRGYIHLNIKDKNDLRRKKKLLENWYREKAKLKFGKVLKNYEGIIKKEYNSMRIRKMKTHWGSCSLKGNITLNLELIKKPKYCIEYVVFHELSHLIYHNHSKEFYEYLTIHMPDWKWRKDKLEIIN